MASGHTNSSKLKIVLIAVLSVSLLAKFYNLKEVSRFSWKSTPPEYLKVKNMVKKELPSPSVYLQSKGGMGNQLFDFACNYALARKLNFPLYVRIPDEEIAKKRRFESGDRPFVLDLFEIPLSPERSVTSSWKVGNLTPLGDQDLLSQSYDSKPDLDHLRFITAGYCQGEIFFSRYEKELLPMFQIKPEVLSLKYSEMSAKIHRLKCSISLHIRRGDFSSYRRMPVSFFQLALIKMDKMLKRKNIEGCMSPESRNFFIFSDNSVLNLKKEFGEKFFLDLKNYEMVSNQGLSSIEEFKLMSECDHNIISASSYGWWAAYLNKNEEKVVIAGRYHPKMFEIEKTPNAEYLAWQKRYIYNPVDWVVIDPWSSTISNDSVIKNSSQSSI